MLFAFVPQQFFPSAERNQFVIDVWMPQGTRIDYRRSYESNRKASPPQGCPEHYATFVGQERPEILLHVNPQQPDGAYGRQFIVNTASVKGYPGW
jgi:multidrug efflux pump subunit AcrB